MRENSSSYRIGIYVRESRDDNEENYETIETQKGLLVDYVMKNKLGDVVEIYIDDNVSGSVFERKGIERMKGDIASGRINLLLLKDLSRLGRNNAKTLLLLDFMEEYGVRVITYDGRYDSTRDNDTVGIDTWYNERYVRDLSKKIRANLRFKIARGEYLGHAPYGYKKSKEQKNRLVVDESTACVIREIFAMYRAGYGYSYIAKKLDIERYLPPAAKEGLVSGSKGWNAVAVKRILCNMVYTGNTVQGVSEKVNFKSKKTRRLPKESWVVTEGTHEAIISREEFEEVQRIREQKNPGTGPHKGKLHLFRGLVFCGKCGSAMIARQRINRPMGYICSNYVKNGRLNCTSHYVNEAEIRDILKRDLFVLLEREEIKAKLLSYIESNLYGSENVETKLDQLGRALREKQIQQEVLYLDRLEGRISEQLFTRMNSNMENRISLLAEDIGRLKNRKTEVISSQKILEYILRRIGENEITNEVAKLLVKRILVFDKGQNADDMVNCSISDVQKDLIFQNGGLVVDYRFTFW